MRKRPGPAKWSMLLLMLEAVTSFHHQPEAQHPKSSAIHKLGRPIIPSFAHLGRDAEAREAAARVLEFDPAFTISAWIARGGQSNAKLLIEGLRKAGLPE